MIHHAGGYDEASALIAFVLEKNAGEAVVVKAAGPAQSMAEIVVLHVLNRLLAVEWSDLLSNMVAQVNKPRPAAGDAGEPLPDPTKNLSLPLEVYVST